MALLDYLMRNKNQESTPDPIGGFYASPERELAICKLRGQLAVRKAFEQMMLEVDAGRADRVETIAAMSSVMGMINRFGSQP